MTRMLSEAEAWREIARRIAEGEWQMDGLCYEARTLLGAFDWHEPDPPLLTQMFAHVKSHMLPEALPDEGAWPLGEADVRVLAALFLALECEDEAKAAKRGAA